MRFERNRQDVGRIAQLGDKFSGIGGADLNTKLLLHNDGSLIDSSQYAKLIKKAYGVEVDTAQKVFGSASLKIPSTASSYITIPHSDDWYINSDYTIDFWVRFISVPTASTDKRFVCSQFENSTNYWYLALRADNLGNLDWLWAITTSGGSAGTGMMHSNPKIAVNTWYHIAAVHYGDDWMIFQDGTLLGQVTDADSTGQLTSELFIGGYGGGLTVQCLSGWLDEFRISKGIARWTGNFTRPDRPYSGKNWE